MKNKIINAVKQYFLVMAEAQGGPFATGFLIGLLLFVITGFATIALQFAGHDIGPGVAFGCLGLALVLGSLNKLVVHLFVRYSPKPWLFFLANEDGKVILDADGGVITADNPLWVPWGMKSKRAELPPTWYGHESEVELSPQVTVTLKISFRSDFVPDEVYREIARQKFLDDFDGWVRLQFRAVVKNSAAVCEQLEAPSPDLAKLTEALEETCFFIPLSNVVRPIKFVVIATVEGRFKAL